MFDLDSAAAFLMIILYDLLLSGDNAVVIGMAARRLSEKNRRRAIVVGGAGAVGLRIGFTLIATYLLDIPLLQALGGLLLLWIAAKLMRSGDHSGQVSEADSLGQAIKTIIIADVIMSLDNILAISAAADGDRWLVLFGLGLSIPLLLIGSDLVSRLLGRFPVLVYLGAILLVWTAVRMIAEDDVVIDFVELSFAIELAATLVISTAIVILGWRTSRGVTLEPV